MQVVLEGVKSTTAHVDSGVPQGTVLGPLLFWCHINDLPDTVKSQVRLFADDCLLYRPIRSIQDHIALQDDLKALEIWASSWGMHFNAKKCYILSINNRSSHFYELNKHILQQVEENPYLGVTISSNLNWDTHIHKIVKKANCTLGFIRRNLKHCPITCRKTAYLALVRSTLEYSSVVWDPHLAKHIDKIERIQRQAARFITGDYRSQDEGCVSSMLKTLELQSLQDRRKTNRLTFLYKVVGGKVPALPCHDILTPARNKRNVKPKPFNDYQATNIQENQVTNNTKCFITFVCKTEQFKNSFFPRFVLDWNKLSDSVVCAASFNSFRTALLNPQLD
jgi:hypothetical protein